MKVCVYGLWHLGTVTAACLAEYFTTVGYDPNAATVSKLLQGQPPVFEPGLAELLQAGLAVQRLSFTNDEASAVKGAEVVWVAFDTPVDDHDIADVGFVRDHIAALFPHLADGTLVLISSQVPAGFTASVEAAFRREYPNREVSFAYASENLRLGKALDTFRHPERIVVGVRSQSVQPRLISLLNPFCRRLEWMSIESAEMTKHALNAFLAMSITFANEVATLCESMGADAQEVERGLKSDARIGPGAYLSPGSAFAGGTLARDVNYLTEIGRRAKVPTHLVTAALRANDEHQGWPRRKLQELLGELYDKTVAVLGLTYKLGTDTLRRSSAIELCIWMAQQGIRVNATDPVITELPTELKPYVNLCATPKESLKHTDAAVIALEWPALKNLTAGDFLSAMRAPIILDPNRFLPVEVQTHPGLRYITVGKRSAL